jgi:hypothetical protein
MNGAVSQHTCTVILQRLIEISPFAYNLAENCCHVSVYVEYPSRIHTDISTYYIHAFIHT